jgi:hypothetical protein
MLVNYHNPSIGAERAARSWPVCCTLQKHLCASHDLVKSKSAVGYHQDTGCLEDRPAQGGTARLCTSVDLLAQIADAMTPHHLDNPVSGVNGAAKAGPTFKPILHIHSGGSIVGDATAE